MFEYNLTPRTAARFDFGHWTARRDVSPCQSSQMIRRLNQLGIAAEVFIRPYRVKTAA